MPTAEETMNIAKDAYRRGALDLVDSIAECLELGVACGVIDAAAKSQWDNFLAAIRKEAEKPMPSGSRPT